MARSFTPQQVAALREVKELLDRAFAPARPTKGDQLIDMLSRPKGATLNDVIRRFDIKPNSAYARISVESRKRGLKVERVDGRYRVAA